MPFVHYGSHKLKNKIPSTYPFLFPLMREDIKNVHCNEKMSQLNLNMEKVTDMKQNPHELINNGL